MRLPIKRAELVQGKVVELPHRMLNGAALVGQVGAFLRSYIEENDAGLVAFGGSFLMGRNNVRMPAISFMSHADLEGENTGEIISKAPTLAVEILYKEDAEDAFDLKAAEFLRAGSQAVWIVNPRRRSVAVHTPDNMAVTYLVGDTMPGGEMLPGLELPVADIFEDLEETQLP